MIKKIDYLLLLICLIGIFGCTKQIPPKKNSEQLRIDSITKIDLIKKDSIKKVESLMRQKYNFINYTNQFIKENPNWNNNGFTKKEGDKKFKTRLIEDFNKIGYYNKFELKKVLVDGKKVHIYLDAKTVGVWLSIVGTLDKSIDVSSLKEGYTYKITGGKFQRFIGPESVASLTGWRIMLETDEFGYNDGSYCFGSSYWRNLELSSVN